MSNEKLLEVAIAGAMRAGKSLLDNYRQTVPITTKESMRDLTTTVDFAAEQEVFKILKKYDNAIPILSEEHGFQGNYSSLGYWVVDALDGTVNYLNQVPFFSVSISFIKNGAPLVGVVYAPLVDDIYYGAEGVGAFKNQNKMQVNDYSPKESLFSASFSGKNYEPLGRQEEFLLFGRVNDQSRGCLRTGSAALNLAYLAEGRFNGCWGKANKKWDISAGLLLAKLAGANVHTVGCDPEQHLYHYLAAPPQNFIWLKQQIGSILAINELEISNSWAMDAL